VPAAILPLLVRIDARRPASWLACGMAAAAVAALAVAGSGAAVVAPAIACGGWAAAAAVGRPPRGLVPGGAAVDAAWWWERAAWPLGGCLAAAAGVWLMAGNPPSLAAGLVIGVAGMTAVAAGAAVRGATPADASSLGLVVSSAAATAAGCGGAAGAAGAVGCGVATTVLGAGAAWLAWRWGRDRSWPAADPARPTMSLVELGLARGSLRRALTGLAMVMALAGMAVGSFLVPAAGAAGVVLALAWFAALTVPAAAAAVARGHGPGGGPPLAAAIAAGYAALLGWPPMVAGILHMAETGIDLATPAVWAWLTVLSLAVAAGAVVGLVRAAVRLSIGPETLLACAASLVILAVVASLPVLRRLPGGVPETRVEKMARLAR
jgi:hypothetical protein